MPGVLGGCPFGIVLWVVRREQMFQVTVSISFAVSVNLPVRVSPRLRLSLSLSIFLSGPSLGLQRALSERKNTQPSKPLDVCVRCVAAVRCVPAAAMLNKLRVSKKASESYIYAYVLKLPLNRLAHKGGSRPPRARCDHRCLSVGRSRQPWVPRRWWTPPRRGISESDQTLDKLEVPSQKRFAGRSEKKCIFKPFLKGIASFSGNLLRPHIE